MKYASLFSGVGGFDLGFERAGMSCSVMVEWDAKCQAVLRKRFPNAKLYKDVNDVGKNEIGAIELVCGGFPCQDVSLAGKRKGLAGERSGLWFEYVRIIEETSPNWVIIENVAGLLSSNEGRDLSTILVGLEERGYFWSYRVLDTQYFGAPQRRRRIFIVANRDWRRPVKVLFDGVATDQDIRTDFGEASDNRAQGQAADEATAAQTASKKEEIVALIEGFQGGVESKTVHPTLVCGGSKMGTGYAALAKFGVDGWIRKATPEEMEALHGFPRGWTNVYNANYYTRQKQLGNAVSPVVAFWLGERIMKVEQDET